MGCDKRPAQMGYGTLISEKDLDLQKRYFEEMVQLLGVYVIHRAPKSDKHYTTYGEVISHYDDGAVVGCIFEEHPNQKTMRRLGWNAELQSSSSLISVPYDTEGLQKGSLFIIPSAFNPKEGRLFRVVSISSIMIYPASLSCELVPEYKNTFSPESYNHQHDSYNLLNREDDE